MCCAVEMGRYLVKKQVFLTSFTIVVFSRDILINEFTFDLL